MIEPSQARYRSAVAFQRLANALGITLLPTDEDCVCLERLAMQAERWKRFDQCADERTFERLSCPSTEDIEEDLEERVREEIADDRAREDWENHSE